MANNSNYEGMSNQQIFNEINREITPTPAEQRGVYHSSRNTLNQIQPEQEQETQTT